MLRETVNAMDGYLMTIKGVASLINDIHMASDSGDYIYGGYKYIVLENVLLKVIDEMEEFRDKVDEKRFENKTPGE